MESKPEIHIHPDYYSHGVLYFSDPAYDRYICKSTVTSTLVKPTLEKLQGLQRMIPLILALIGVAPQRS